MRQGSRAVLEWHQIGYSLRYYALIYWRNYLLFFTFTVLYMNLEFKFFSERQQLLHLLLVAKLCQHLTRGTCIPTHLNTHNISFVSSSNLPYRTRFALILTSQMVNLFYQTIGWLSRPLYLHFLLGRYFSSHFFSSLLPFFFFFPFTGGGKGLELS